MKKAWVAWARLLSQQEEGTSLALFRIAVALVMLSTLVSVMWSGTIDALWIERAHGGIRDPRNNPVIVSLLGATPRVVWSLTLFACATCAAMAAGIGGRWMVAVASIAYLSVSGIGAAAGGYDAMICNAAWLLFLSSSTATLSLDCRLRHGRWTSDRRISAWPRLLAIGQLVLIYTATGLQKTGVSWTFADGYSALYWYMQDPTWTRFDMGWTAHVYPLMRVLTFLVWHFEVGAPLLLVILYFRYTRAQKGPPNTSRVRGWMNARDLRKPWAAFGISMHLGIAVLLEMGPFSWISLAYSVCIWRPEEWQRLARVVIRLTDGRLGRPIS